MGLLFTFFIINSFALLAKKTQDYYTIKYTFPFCHKVSKWNFLVCKNLRVLSAAQKRPSGIAGYGS
jgi:hypothetical protein